MEGFSFVTPITGLNGPNSGKEEDDDVVTELVMDAAVTLINLDNL
jgi:hypothetical protein